MKTSDLIGPALDWSVEFIEGGCKAEPRANYWLEKWVDPERRYLCESASTNWSQGGPIIERENITIIRANSDYVDGKNVPRWFAETDKWVGHGIATSIEGEYFDPCFMVDEAGGKYGPTPLIAALRCYVASKLGDEVEIPSELQP